MIARVLLVDDDTHVLRALATWLSRAGFEVATAEDSAPALRMAQTTLFDLIVVDYNMGTSRGVDVVRHFKQRYGDAVYCAILSGDDGDATRDECMLAGADDVFMKPASPVELRRRLTQAALALRGDNV